MKTVIIGGGRGCRALIELAGGQFLKELPLEILCVVDPQSDAPGILYARENGIPTSGDMPEALALPDIELIIELTGRDNVLEEIYRVIAPGTRLIDHTSARIFWDLVNARNEREWRLQEMTLLEQRIEQERHFLQSVLDNLPQLVVVLGPDRRTIMINKSFARFAGISPEEGRGKTCLELLANTPLACNCRETAPMLDRIFEIGKPLSMIWQIPPPNEMYWEVTRTPILNREGTVEAVLCTWHRITEEVLLRREIESGEQRFKSLIDSAQDWISMKDLSGRYIAVNPVCALAFHRKPEDFIGKTPEEMMPPHHAQTVRHHDGEVIRTDHPHTYEEIIPLEGRDRVYHTVRFPVKDYKGETVGVCTIARDVTEQAELKNQLVQATKLAALGKLAAGVAHEINNPLTGILAYAEDMLDNVDQDDPQHDDLQVIIRETLRCRDIVRNLLDFSRQESPRLEPIDPNAVVDQSLLLVERLPQFRNIAIRREKTDELPQIQGDIHQLQQVVLNFMMNAAEAMNEKGMIMVSTEYDRRYDRCIIAVRDTGPGIPENLIDKIFEPFFSTKGTNGLGLAVSWGIVERHSGTIEVDTPDGGGAEFRIVLPRAKRNTSRKTRTA